jgi:hypothetical protein
MDPRLEVIRQIKDILSACHQIVADTESHKIIDHIWDEVTKLEAPKSPPAKLVSLVKVEET